MKTNDYFKIILTDDEILKCIDRTKPGGIHFDILQKVKETLINKYINNVKLLANEHYKDKKVTYIEESLNVGCCAITFTVYFEDLKS
jgi:DhnA family fructose-bisphosphate aldolase class Ia